MFFIFLNIFLVNIGVYSFFYKFDINKFKMMMDYVYYLIIISKKNNINFYYYYGKIKKL